MSNPTSAIDALLSAEKETGGVIVFPVTLARYALLELVESPFVRQPDKLTGFWELLPTIYIMTTQISELKKYNSRNVEELTEKAIEYAEKLSPDTTADILDRIGEQMRLINEVAPEDEQDGDSTQSAKKAQTAG